MSCWEPLLVTPLELMILDYFSLVQLEYEIISNMNKHGNDFLALKLPKMPVE